MLNNSTDIERRTRVLLGEGERINLEVTLEERIGVCSIYVVLYCFECFNFLLNKVVHEDLSSIKVV